VPLRGTDFNASGSTSRRDLGAQRFSSKSSGPSLGIADRCRVGLVPHCAKDLKCGARCINARAETVQTTPAFRDAFESRRCIIPASGFYEWRKNGTTKTPYAIDPSDEPLFAFAGLSENWRDQSARGRRGVDQDR
jgi:putative SOS response-associated peptidase YedK